MSCFNLIGLKCVIAPEALRQILVSTEQSERIDCVEKELSVQCNSKRVTTDSEIQTDALPLQFETSKEIQKINVDGHQAEFFRYLNNRLNGLVPFNQFMDRSEFFKGIMSNRNLFR